MPGGSAATTGVIVSPIRMWAQPTALIAPESPGVYILPAGPTTVQGICAIIGSGLTRLTWAVQTNVGTPSAGTTIQIVAKTGNVERILDEVVWPIASQRFLTDGFATPLVFESVRMDMVIPAGQLAGVRIVAGLFASSF